MTSTEQRELSIPPSIESNDAAEAKQSVCMAMEKFTDDDDVVIMCNDVSPSVLSLQLAFACHKSLTKKVKSVTYDDNLAPLLDHSIGEGARA